MIAAEWRARREMLGTGGDGTAMTAAASRTRAGMVYMLKTWTARVSVEEGNLLLAVDSFLPWLCDGGP